MNIDSAAKKDFKRRLYKDKEFLKSCNLMDYSLLMIFLKKKEGSDIESNGSRKMSFYIKRGVNGDEIEMEEVPKELVNNTQSYYRPTPPQSSK